MKYLSIIFILIFAISAQSATYIVTRSDDRNEICNSGVDCSMREAIKAANAVATDDTINFASDVTTVTLTDEISLHNAGTLTINGNGANVLTIDGGVGTNRIFFVSAAKVTIQGVTLSGGNGGAAAVYAFFGTTILEAVVVQNNVGGSGFLGAVYFERGTNHRIANSTLSGNTGFRDCAAIYADNASLTVVNTTVSGNSTLASGVGTGAICINGGSTATFRNTTISGNTAGSARSGGGGIYISGTSTVNLGNTIVAGNTAAGSGPDLYRLSSTSTFTTSGGNLIGDNSGNLDAPNTTTFPTGNPNANGDIVGSNSFPINPMLAALANNGGTTPTHALLAESPAIDAGNNSNSPATTDQRGFTRIVNGIIDIGAFERESVISPTCTYSINPTSQTFNGTGGNGSVTITTQPGCSFSSLSNSSFITITSGAGTGNGTVTFMVAANKGAARTGTLFIAGQTFTVNQSKARIRTRITTF